MPCLVIKGFENVEQVKAFADWYIGSGEQSAADHFDIRGEDVPWCTTSGPKGEFMDVVGDMVTIYLKDK